MMDQSDMFTASPPRQRWGMGDILLSLPFIVVGAAIGSGFGLGFSSLDLIEDLAEGTSNELPTAVVAGGLIGQQAAQAAWPAIVSWWKGAGLVADWRLQFRPADFWIGPAVGLFMLVSAGVTGLVTSELVNLEDESAAENTGFLTDAEGTPWLYVLMFAVVVGAPVSEELFFRGLCLRAIGKRFGVIVGVIGSSIIFTLPHFIGSGWEGTVVLFSVIGLVGLTLGVLVAALDRLGPAIIAHMVFNAVGVLGALGVIEEREQAFGALARLIL